MAQWIASLILTRKYPGSNPTDVSFFFAFFQVIIQYNIIYIENFSLNYQQRGLVVTESDC